MTQEIISEDIDPIDENTVVIEELAANIFPKDALEDILGRLLSANVGGSLF